MKKVAALAGQKAVVKPGLEGTNTATVTFTDAAASGDEISAEAKKLLDFLKKVAAKFGSIDISMPPAPTGSTAWGTSYGNSKWGPDCNIAELKPGLSGWNAAWALLHELFHIGVYHEAYDSAYDEHLMDNAKNYFDPTEKEKEAAAAHATKVAIEATSHGTDIDPDTMEPVVDKVDAKVSKVQEQVRNTDTKKGPAKKLKKKKSKPKKKGTGKK